MSFLARFAAIEKECENNNKNVKQKQPKSSSNSKVIEIEESEEENEENEGNEGKKKKQGKEDENEEGEEFGWIERSNKDTKSKITIKLHETIVKTVPLSTLVWATLLNIRGGSSYVLARLCNPVETVHYRFHNEDLTEEGLIPTGKVVVEYFCLPESLPQYAIKDPSTLKAYNESIRKDFGPVSKWNEYNLNYMLKTVLRRKFNSQISQYIFDRASSVANEFLSLALQHQVEESLASHNVSSSSPNPESSSSSPTTVSQQPIVDMSLFVLPPSPVKCRFNLTAGDWIGYEDKIFKSTKVTQIIEINTTNDSNSPLTLANGDVLFPHDLICKYYHTTPSEPPTSSETTTTTITTTTTTNDSNSNNNATPLRRSTREGRAPTSSSKKKSSKQPPQPPLIVTTSSSTIPTEHLGYYHLEEYNLRNSVLSGVKSIHQQLAQETKEHLNELESEAGLVLNRKKKRKSIATNENENSKKKRDA